LGKKKLGFSPSKSEFIMLCFLLFVAVVALMLNYLVFPAYNSFKQEKNSYDQQMLQLDHLKREYDALDTYKENEAGIDGDLSALNSLIPPYFSQEEMTARAE
jgi:hypothetical protein